MNQQESVQIKRGKQALRRIHPLDFVQKNMPWAILAVIASVFAIFSKNFLSINNIVNILTQSAYVIVAALGIALIMMSGAIDLSVGYQMSMIGVICALCLAFLPTWLVMIIGILLGVGLNLLNMVLSLKLKIPLMMVTVGTMTIFQGISFELSQSRTIGGFPDSFRFLGQGMLGSVPFPILITAVLFVIMSFFLSKTYMGRYVYALGGNEEATRLAGINVTRVKVMIAVIAGVFVALSGMMLISRIGSAQSNVGPGTEFTVITGVLLGGVSIRGGEGKLSGVMAGILIVAILSNGMQLVGMGIYYQFVAKGIIMLAAIGFDVFQMKRRQMKNNLRVVERG